MESAPKRSESFTQKQLEEAWMNYRGQQKDPFIRAIMRDHLPTIKDDHTLYMELGSQTEASQIEMKMDDLMCTLADELHNDLIRLNISIVATPVEVLPKSPKDILAFLEEQNEDFKKMVTVLNLQPKL